MLAWPSQAATSWPDAGVDIQSHSLTHPFLTRARHQSLSDAEYEAWVEKELVQSKKILALDEERLAARSRELALHVRGEALVEPGLQEDVGREGPSKIPSKTKTFLLEGGLEPLPLLVGRSLRDEA